MPEQEGIQRQIESIEGLVRQIEQISNAEARSLSKQLVQSLMDLHRAGLQRILEIVHRVGSSGQRAIDEMGEEEPARSLLLLHGLHPLDLETRVLQALEQTHQKLRSQGGEVRLVRISESGAVVLHLEGGGSSCPSSSATLTSALEQAIYEAAPDVTGILVESVPSRNAAFLPLSVLQGSTEPNGNRGADGRQGTVAPQSEPIDCEEAQRSAR